MKLTVAFLLAILSLAALPAFAATDAAGNLVLDHYTEISKALAADDLAATRTAAKTLAATAKGEHPELAEEANAVASSNSLEAAREKFKALSNDAEKLAKGKEGYFVMHCPMAKADWVQKDKNVANPYFGKEMPKCGSLKK